MKQNNLNLKQDATLVFLVKKTDGKIKDICLAMKKRGFGINKWNGVGGKVNGQNETIEEAARREVKEEILVDVKDLKKVAELSFYFSYNPTWDQIVHVYFTEKWEGKPKESDEMKPIWFLVDDLPFHDMWADDIFWLPEVIKGNLIKAMFKFGEKDVILDKKINTVNQF